MKAPTPHEIKAARTKAGLTQTEAAEKVGRQKMAWWHWENGRAEMAPGLFELFLIKTRQKS